MIILSLGHSIMYVHTNKRFESMYRWYGQNMWKISHFEFKVQSSKVYYRPQARMQKYYNYKQIVKIKDKTYIMQEIIMVTVIPYEYTLN